MVPEVEHDVTAYGASCHQDLLGLERGERSGPGLCRTPADRTLKSCSLISFGEERKYTPHTSGRRTSSSAPTSSPIAAQIFLPPAFESDRAHGREVTPAIRTGVWSCAEQ
jgi:hypothetical protein